MKRLGFLTLAALAAALTCAAPAAAQPEIPCEIPPNMIVTTELAAGELNHLQTDGGLGYDAGALIDRALDECLGIGPNRKTREANLPPGFLTGLGDAAAELAPLYAAPGTLSVGALNPDGQSSYRWRLGLDYAHFSFDEYEGSPIRTLSVDQVTASIARTFREQEARASFVGIRFPWVLDLSGEWAGVPIDEDGPGDVQVFTSVHLKSSAQGRYHGLLEGLLSLPTGEDHEGLGFGEPAVRVGLRFLYSSRDRQELGSSAATAYLLREAGAQANGPCNSAPSPASPSSGIEAHVGLTYQNVFEDAGHDTIELSGGFSYLNQRWILELTQKLVWEVSDGPDGLSRDAGFMADLGVAGWIRLNRGPRSPTRTTYLRLGMSTRLTDDGLVDRLTPMVGIHHYWNPRH